MAAFSGKDGVVKVDSAAVAQVTKWDAELSAAIDKFGHSDSDGWKDGVAGTKDIKGTLEAKFPDSGSAPFEEGEKVSLSLLTDSGTTPKGSLVGDALIASMKIEVDIDTGKAVGASVSWEGVGAWTKTGIFSKGS